MLLHSVIKELLFISFPETFIKEVITQQIFTCSRSTTERLEKGVKLCSKLKIKTPERRQ